MANRILADLDLPPRGHQLMAVTSGPRQHNTVIAIRRLAAAINEEVGMPTGTRGDWSREQFTTIFDRIDEIGDSVRDTLRTQLSQRG